MKRKFGVIDDIDYYLYTIENEYLKVEVTNFGATLVSLIDKQSQQNCVLNFSSVEEYYENIDQARGSTVGRNCNRIEKGLFEIDGVKYQCFINNGPNSLHGGQKGFMYQNFKVLSHDETAIALSYFSKDLEEGFTGNLTTTIIYRLDKNSLYYEIVGISDKKTIFNITNHSYFNLGDKDIFNHKLLIPSNEVAMVDENGLTLDKVIDVTDTSFDFRKSSLIKEKFDLGHDNLKLVRGYDHNYLFEKSDSELRAILTFDKLSLKVESDLPGMHLYSGNYLTKPHEGLALECQYYPNSINYDKYLKPIIDKNVLTRHYIKYTIERM